jgi:hypothetical protein
MSKHANPIPYFNAEAHVKELNERFSRLIKSLGANNRRMFSMEENKFIDGGTARYNFEANFAHALNEIEQCPSYMQGKMFDKASVIVSRLITHLKTQKDSEASTEA